MGTTRKQAISPATRMKRTLTLALVLSACCVPGPDAAPPGREAKSGKASMDGKATSEAQVLARRLIAREFGPFFEYPQHDRTVDAVWADPKHHGLLAEIARTKTMPAEARFLACRVLVRQD